MPGIVDLVAALARFVQIGGACLLTGIFAFLVLVARPAVRAAGGEAPASFGRLDRRLLLLAAVALGAATAAGLVDLARQSFVATRGGVAGSLAPQTVGLLLLETRYGDVWLIRHAFWLLLAALLVLRGPERDRSDWLALRIGGLTLAGAGLVAGAASGHAASAAERPDLAIAVDALHLLAAGVWTGALIPLVLFLRWARPDRAGTFSAHAAAAAVAVAVRRFSTLALLSVVVVLASGVYAVLQQVGGVPPLLGTTYGHWLLLKLALLLPLLGVAFLNRAYLRPRLERAAVDGAGEAEAGALTVRLRRFVAFEALLVAAILAAVAVLGLTTPARHDPIVWPLPFRLVWDTTTSLPPLAVDAYPTTYLRPTVPYTSASIVRGHALYREHCASCHGTAGAGDGPAAAGSKPRPSNLTGRRVADHTAGDLYWWLTHGVPGSTMIGFGDRFSPEQRWDVVNFVRVLSAAEQARGLAPVASLRPTIVAPDVGYTTGVGAERSLREYRPTVILLVFFQLPASLERLTRLGRRHFDFRLTGAEILAVPLERAGAVYRELGHRPVIFPVVIGGAEQAAAAYGLFQRDLSVRGGQPDPPMPVHMEMLIDRQGYVRARWLPPGSPDAAGGWNDLEALLIEVGNLSREPASAPPPGEHIH